jgi:hypothetical protein
MARSSRRDDPSSDPEVQELKKDWSSLTHLQRGQRLVPLRERYSQRSLGPALGVSEKTVRNCLLRILPNLSQQSKLGQFGAKKQLRFIRAGLAFDRHLKELLSGPSRLWLRSKLAGTLEQWFKDNVPPSHWDLVLDMVLNPFTPGLKEIWENNFCRDASQCALDSDWEKVIAETKPPDPVGQNPFPNRNGSVSAIPPPLEVFHTFLLEWLSRWYNRCMPDGTLQAVVLEEVRDRLRLYARKEYPDNQWEVGG